MTTVRAFLLILTAVLSGLFLFAHPSASLSSGDAGSSDDGKQPTSQLATFQGHQVPLREALDQLATQTSESAVGLMGDPDPKVDVDWKGVPFWDALDALADRAGGRVDLHSRDGRIAVVPRPVGWHPPRLSHNGLFRITLNAITSKLDLETDGRTCNASIEVAWEPHLLPLLLETRPSALVVRDDDGTPVPGEPAGSSLAPVDGRNSLSFDVSLPPVTRTVKSLNLLQGEFYAIAPTKMLTFVFGPLDQLKAAGPDDPRRQATQEGVRCRVSKVVAEEDHWSVEITLDYPEGNVKLDSYQSWVVNNEIHLEGKDGDRFASSTYLVEESTPRRAVLTYHFSDPERMKRGLGEWKIVYRTPALVVKVPVPFSFQDVPLP